VIIIKKPMLRRRFKDLDVIRADDTIRN